MTFNALPLIDELESRFPDIFLLFQKTGIHPLGLSRALDPRSGVWLAQDYRNVGHHSIAVWSLAKHLGDELAARGFFTPERLVDLERRALLHDVRKPYDLMWGCDPRSEERLRAELPALLVRRGFTSAEIDAIMLSGSEVSHIAIPSYISPRGTLRAGLWLEKILFFADSVTATGRPTRTFEVPSSYLTPTERAERSKFKERYPWLYRGGYAADENGAIIGVSELSEAADHLTVLGSWYELQVRITEEIASELLDILGVTLWDGSPSRVLIDRMAPSRELDEAA